MLHDRLKQLREAKSLTRKEVAESIGLEQSTYGKYEKGQRQPSYQVLIELSNFYDVSIDFLTGKSQTTHPLTQQHVDNTYTKIKETFGEEAEVMFHDISQFDEEDFEKLKSLVQLVKNQKK